MSEHRAIGPVHLAFRAVLDALLAHDTLLAGRWTIPGPRVGKDEQPPALHLVPHEPIQIHGVWIIVPARSTVCPQPNIAKRAPHAIGRRWPCSSTQSGCAYQC